MVFAVHTERPDDAVGAVEIVYASEQDARRYAESRSRDYTITSASITRFTVGQLGTRTAVAWYRNGDEQERQWVDRTVYPSG